MFRRPEPALTALVQQGSQLAGTFGGVRGAIAAVASSVTPLVAVIGAAAAAVIGLGAAAYKGAEDSQAIARALILSGNAAGITAGEFRSLAKVIAQEASTSLGSAQSTLQALVESGRFSGDALKPTAVAIELLSRISGQSTDEIVKDFIGMANNIGRSATQLAEHYRRVLTPAQLEQIRTLEESGDRSKAVVIVMDALVARLRSAQGTFGGVSNAAREAKNALSDFFHGIADAVGGTKAVEDRIAAIRAQLEALDSRRSQNPAATAARRAALQDRLREALAEQQAERQSAETSGRDARQQEAKTAFIALQNQYLSRQQRMQQEILAANELAKRGQIDEKDRLALIDDIQKRFSESKPNQANEYLDSLRQQLQGVQELTAYERVLAEVQSGRLVGASTQQVAQAESVAVEIDTQRAFAQALKEGSEASSDWLRRQLAIAEQSRHFIDSVSGQNEALREEIAVIEGGEPARRALEIARADDAIASRQQARALAELNGATAAELRSLDAEIAKLQERRDLIGQRNRLGDDTQRGGDILKRLGDAEDSAQNRRDAGKTTELQHLYELGQARQKASEQLKEYIRDQEESGRGANEQTEAARRALERLSATADPVAQKFDQIFTGSFSNAFADFIAGAKSAKQAFAAFASDVVAQIARIVAERTALGLFGAGAGGGSGGTSGALGTLFSSWFGGGKADGGSVEAGGIYRVNERSGPGEIFSTGGQQYLLANQSGTINPNTQQASRGVVQHITFNVSQPASRQTQAQIATQIGQATQQALSRNS